MKNGKKETRHLGNPHNVAATICGREIGKVLLWAKKTPPKADDATVCGRCQKLRAGQAAKIEKKHKEIREATKAMASEALEDTAKIVRSATKRQPALAILGDRMPPMLVVLFKGKEFTAKVNEDGTIEQGGSTFKSPSRAGKNVAGREVDGWTFWSYLKADGTTEKLDALRKAAA